MTSHRLTAEDVTAIIEEKNKLVRENYQLRLMVANLRLSIEQYKKALQFIADVTGKPWRGVTCDRPRHPH